MIKMRFTMKVVIRVWIRIKMMVWIMIWMDAGNLRLRTLAIMRNVLTEQCTRIVLRLTESKIGFPTIPWKSTQCGKDSKCSLKHTNTNTFSSTDHIALTKNHNRSASRLSFSKKQLSLLRQLVAERNDGEDSLSLKKTKSCDPPSATTRSWQRLYYISEVIFLEHTLFQAQLMMVNRGYKLKNISKPLAGLRE
ncbi:unnamed protein product [Nesidiocoris tenuis]|uniref:Uncharacterized protein n=1 Tax=Nesidiocoris tenuis TaxID=355587 RepID=A0A6H5G6J0_9HEMI|nr:unnamed protein product [Nesidiocoris tenuis]